MKPSTTTFPQFATAVFRDTGIADHLTPVQLQIADYMANGPSRRVVCAFRGCGKSTLAAVYAAYRLWVDPNQKVLLLSASSSRAEAMAVWIARTFIDVPWLRHLAPDTKMGRYSKIAFDVGACLQIEQSHSVRATGVTGQITGSRANLIIPDDIETPTTCLTQVQREKLRGVLGELNSILKPGPENDVLFLGTPHSSSDSIYFHLRRDLGYGMQIWPARVPEDTAPYNGCLAPLVESRVLQSPGRPTDTRFSDDELRTRELAMSPLSWRLQFQLDATLSDAERYPLKLGDLMVSSLDKQYPEVVTHSKKKEFKVVDLPCCGMQGDTSFYYPETTEGLIEADDLPTVMAIDPSAGGSDEFAYVVVKVWGGNYYLVEVGGKRNGSDDAWWRKLALSCKRHHVNQVVIETNFGGLDVWAQVFKPHLRALKYGCAFEPFRSNQQKQLRIIDTLAPLMQSHRVVVARRVIEEDYKLVEASTDEKDLSFSLFHQMSRITYDRGCLYHDDRLDALAMACQWFQEQAAQDQQVRMADRRQELLEACLADSQGYVLMNAGRLGMGMTLEQARKAASGDQGSSWLKPRR